MAEVTKKEEKKLKKTVKEIVKEISENGSNRFSNGDFKTLVFAILSDDTFEAEKWIQRGGELTAVTNSVSADMRKFLNKLLKHAGFADQGERDRIIETFEYGVNDISFVVDAIDEAMYQYTEAGKNLWIFREKVRRLAVKKVERTGKYEGKSTYKKSVTDRMEALKRAKKKADESAD